MKKDFFLFPFLQRSSVLEGSSISFLCFWVFYLGHIKDDSDGDIADDHYHLYMVRIFWRLGLSERHPPQFLQNIYMLSRTNHANYTDLE